MSKKDLPPRSNLSVQNLLLRGVPYEYVEGTLEDYKQEKDIKVFFERYLKNLHVMYDDRINVCMYGANGTGKTFLASLIVKEAYRLRYSSAMTTLANLLDLSFKTNKSPEDMYKLNLYRDADFLVLDEVGKEYFTKTGSNVNLLEEVLRRAVVNGQVVIICTNLPLDGDGGLYKQYGSSIKSLISGSFTRLEFDDDDYRPIHQKQKKALQILAGKE
jgi:DNA replication protein DnaC